MPHRKGEHGPGLLAEIAKGGLSAVAGSHLLGGAAAGAAGFIFEKGLKRYWPFLMSPTGDPQSLLLGKMTEDFRHSVLTYPHRARESRISLLGALGDSQLSDKARICALDLIPDDPAVWRGLPSQEALELVHSAGRLSANCCATSPGALAVLEYMRREYRISLDLYYQDGSSREQLRSMESTSMEFDFIVSGSYSFMFASGRQARNFKLLFPVHVDQQCALTKPTKRGKPSSLLNLELFDKRDYGSVFYVPETVNEVFLRRHSGGTPTAEKGVTPADVPHLPSQLNVGDIILAWDPNVDALISQHGLVIVPGSELATQHVPHLWPDKYVVVGFKRLNCLCQFLEKGLTIAQNRRGHVMAVAGDLMSFDSLANEPFASACVPSRS